MKLAIVGYGKMGRLIDELASEHGFEVSARIGRSGDLQQSANADVVVDFSTAEALSANFSTYLRLQRPLVIGTTGWEMQAARFREQALEESLGVVAAANFSIGANIFQMVVEETVRLVAPYADYDAWIHEAHHAAKKDAPSGTALMLQETMVDAGFKRTIGVSSTRAGTIVGKHTVGFDGSSDTIELTHTARDRRCFASGALLAARLIVGRRGWYSMADVLRS